MHSFFYTTIKIVLCVLWYRRVLFDTCFCRRCLSSSGFARMVVYSVYKHQHILYYYFRGQKALSIARLLHGEKLSASRRGVHKFLMKYHETGSISRRPGSGRPSKVMRMVKWLVQQQMQLDDETTAHQLHALLLRNGIQI